MKIALILAILILGQPISILDFKITEFWHSGHFLIAKEVEINWQFIFHVFLEAKNVIKLLLVPPIRLRSYFSTWYAELTKQNTKKDGCFYTFSSAWVWLGLPERFLMHLEICWFILTAKTYKDYQF